MKNLLLALLLTPLFSFAQIKFMKDSIAEENNQTYKYHTLRVRDNKVVIKLPLKTTFRNWENPDNDNFHFLLPDKKETLILFYTKKRDETIEEQIKNLSEMKEREFRERAKRESEFQYKIGTHKTGNINSFIYKFITPITDGNSRDEITGYKIFEQYIFFLKTAHLIVYRYKETDTLPDNYKLNLNHMVEDLFKDYSFSIKEGGYRHCGLRMD